MQQALWVILTEGSWGPPFLGFLVSLIKGFKNGLKDSVLLVFVLSFQKAVISTVAERMEEGKK